MKKIRPFLLLGLFALVLLGISGSALAGPGDIEMKVYPLSSSQPIDSVYTYTLEIKNNTTSAISGTLSIEKIKFDVISPVLPASYVIPAGGTILVPLQLKIYFEGPSFIFVKFYSSENWETFFMIEGYTPEYMFFPVVMHSHSGN